MKVDLNLPSSSGLGVTTIFTVLLILCLTVFSVLTLSAAQADLRLTQKNAQMVSSYFNADNEACAISSYVTAFWPKNSLKPDTFQCSALENSIQKHSANIFNVSVREYKTGFLVEYNITMNASLVLNVSIRIPESGVYVIKAWQMTPLVQEIDDRSLPVWQGADIAR